MKYIKNKSSSLIATVAVVATTLVTRAQLTYAAPDEGGSDGFIGDAQAGISDIDAGGSIGTVPEILQSVVNILLFLIGAASVIMLIIGGLRFVLSAGDSQAAANARNTILYSIIGIVVAVAAYGIVGWVLGRLYT